MTAIFWKPGIRIVLRNVPGAKTAHGDERPEYLVEPDRGVNHNHPGKVRHGQSGDKLRRKAFEGKI